MQNVKIVSNGTKVTIEFDSSPAAQKAAKPSHSGKTRLLASTNGLIPVEAPGCPGLRIALNVMIPV